jgi:hypothetical protein
MVSKPSKRNTVVTVTAPDRLAKRNGQGQFMKGFSGTQGLDVARARKQLNGMTIQAMTEAFQRGGRKAIDKVMTNAPAQFLKMLVLLVPRELEVTHSGGVKGMSDEQLERGIEALELILSKRAAGADAKVIDAQAEPVADTPSATES